MAGDKKTGSGISFVQVLASALAASTATLALSYLGVAGTIMGAAIASVITVVGNYVYGRSLTRTHKAVKTLAHQAAVMVRPGDGDEPLADAAGSPPESSSAEGTDREQVDADTTAKDGGAAPDEDPDADRGRGTPETTEAETPGGADADTDGRAVDAEEHGGLESLPTARPVAAAPDVRDQTWIAQMFARYGTVRTLVALGIAVFLLIMSLVTAVELWLGKPLSDELTGHDSGRSTTFINRPAPPPQQGPESPDQDPDPAPGQRTSPTATPSTSPNPASPTPAPSESSKTPTPDPSESPAPPEPTPDPPDPSETPTPDPSEGNRPDPPPSQSAKRTER
jgi:hypothetical protein